MDEPRRDKRDRRFDWTEMARTCSGVIVSIAALVRAIADLINSVGLL